MAATVTNSGSASAAVFDFGIPAGAPGAAGDGSGSGASPRVVTSNAPAATALAGAASDGTLVATQVTTDGSNVTVPGKLNAQSIGGAYSATMASSVNGISTLAAGAASNGGVIAIENSYAGGELPFGMTNGTFNDFPFASGQVYKDDRFGFGVGSVDPKAGPDGSHTHFALPCIDNHIVGDSVDGGAASNCQALYFESRVPGFNRGIGDTESNAVYGVSAFNEIFRNWSAAIANFHNQEFHCYGSGDCNNRSYGATKGGWKHASDEGDVMGGETYTNDPTYTGDIATASGNVITVTTCGDCISTGTQQTMLDENPVISGGTWNKASTTGGVAMMTLVGGTVAGGGALPVSIAGSLTAQLDAPRQPENVGVSEAFSVNVPSATATTGTVPLITISGQHTEVVRPTAVGAYANGTQSFTALLHYPHEANAPVYIGGLAGTCAVQNDEDFGDLYVLGSTNPTTVAVTSYSEDSLTDRAESGVSVSLMNCAELEDLRDSSGRVSGHRFVLADHNGFVAGDPIEVPSSISQKFTGYGFGANLPDPWTVHSLMDWNCVSVLSAACGAYVQNSEVTVPNAMDPSQFMPYGGRRIPVFGFDWEGVHGTTFAFAKENDADSQVSIGTFANFLGPNATGVERMFNWQYGAGDYFQHSDDGTFWLQAARTQVNTLQAIGYGDNDNYFATQNGHNALHLVNNAGSSLDFDYNGAFGTAGYSNYALGSLHSDIAAGSPFIAISVPADLSTPGTRIDAVYVSSPTNVALADGVTACPDSVCLGPGGASAAADGSLKGPRVSVSNTGADGGAHYAGITAATTGTTGYGPAFMLDATSMGGHKFTMFASGPGDSGGAGSLEILDNTVGAYVMSISSTGVMTIGGKTVCLQDGTGCAAPDPTLAGTGNAFACLDATGKIYRSATACN